MKYNDLIPELVVSNINISRDFYVNMLGFKVEYEREEDKFIFLSLGNIQLMLEEGSEEELSQMEYPFGKGINFTFGVNNVDGDCGRIYGLAGFAWSGTSQCGSYVPYRRGGVRGDLQVMRAVAAQ